MVGVAEVPRVKKGDVGVSKYIDDLAHGNYVATALITVLSHQNDVLCLEIPCNTVMFYSRHGLTVSILLSLQIEEMPARLAERLSLRLDPNEMLQLQSTVVRVENGNEQRWKYRDLSSMWTPCNSDSRRNFRADFTN